MSRRSVSRAAANRSLVPLSWRRLGPMLTARWCTSDRVLPRPADVFDLTGRSAVVTGATGAFGEQAAYVLAAAGAHGDLGRWQRRQAGGGGRGHHGGAAVAALALLASVGSAQSKLDQAVAKALEQVQKGKPEDAVKTMTKAAAEAGAEGQLALARLHERLGNLDEAQAAYSQAKTRRAGPGAPTSWPRSRTSRCARGAARTRWRSPTRRWPPHPRRTRSPPRRGPWCAPRTARAGSRRPTRRWRPAPRMPWPTSPAGKP